MKKVFFKFFCFLLILFTIGSATCGCSSKEKSEYIDEVIFGMDTYTTLRLASDEDISHEYTDKIKSDCAYIIAKNEKILSSRNEDALVYEFNHNADTITNADKTLTDVLNSAMQISYLTDGAYDPTIGALSELWNVNGGGPVPSDENIKECLSHIGCDKIKTDTDNISKSDSKCYIDLGGIGKGYTVQEMLEYLSGTEIPYGLVSMGGNIGVFGSKGDSEKFKVGICDPDDTANVVGYLNISSGFISVSGDYERYFEENGKKYHHIIDPATGYPAESGIRSVAVYANNGAAADALSTALFVMGKDKALEFYDSGKMAFEAVIITENHEIILTKGLQKDDFELANGNYSVITQDNK